MAKLNVSIKSIEKDLYDGQADIVVMRTPSGDVGIMANHVPLVAALFKSDVKIKHSGEEFLFKITEGIAEVLNNKLSIIEFSR